MGRKAGSRKGRREERALLKRLTRRRRRGGEKRAPVPVQKVARKVSDTAGAVGSVGAAAVRGDRPLWVGLLAVTAAGVVLLSGPMQSFLDQRERVELLRDQLSALEAENGDLNQQVADLNDPGQIELRAREEQGMIYPGEVPYAIVPPEVDRPQIAPPRTEPADPDPAWYQRAWSFLADLFG